MAVFRILAPCKLLPDYTAQEHGRQPYSSFSHRFCMSAKRGLLLWRRETNYKCESPSARHRTGMQWLCSWDVIWRGTSRFLHEPDIVSKGNGCERHVGRKCLLGAGSKVRCQHTQVGWEHRRGVGVVSFCIRNQITSRSLHVFIICCQLKAPC
jgi:hypothetical protein